MSGAPPAILGVGESAFSRRSPRPFAQLAIDAITGALTDAGVAPGAVDAVVADGGLMPALFPTDEVVHAFGLTEVQHVVEPTRGVGYATHLAAELVRAGLARCALVYSGTDWGTSSGGPYAFHERWPAKLGWEMGAGFYGQPVYYAALAQRYAAYYGIDGDRLTTALGHLAVNTRRNAATHPNSQLRQPLTLAEHAAAEMIADPLRKPDCSLVTDGAGALVVGRPDLLADPGRAVHVLAGAHAEDPAIREEEMFSHWPDPPTVPAATRSSRRALARADLALADVDVFGIYDCFTISALAQIEAIGLSEPGGAVDLLTTTSTAFDGPLPINTHGGLIGNGHVIGVNHIVELVRQLRGERGEGQVPGARTGLMVMPPNRYSTSLVLARDAP